MSKYTLIITEKPDAVMRIALAIDENQNPKRVSENGVPYYVAKRQKEILIVPSLGHLYTIIGTQKGRNYPAFAYKWAPRYVAEKKNTRIRTWIQTIARLARNADAFTDACDYDIEGCIIGYCILKYACGNMDRIAKRMKYSTLTRQDLKKAYSRLLPHLDSSLIQAGCARHEIDWLYGINLSRALTSAAKKWSGRYTTISTGRVQGPTLKFVVAREEAIKTFVPRPYWEIKAEVEIDGKIFVAKCAAGKISNKSDAESIVSAFRDKNGQIDEVEVRQFKQAPPFPFNLGTLQNEAYAVFKYTPQRVLNIAQQLYLKALISYPRTDSQKLPPAIGYRKILKNLSKKEQFKTVASELLAEEILKPNEGKKDDPAHPAIYPTGNLPDQTLTAGEKRLWELTVLRFMSVFGEPAIEQITKVSMSVEGHHLNVCGRRILKKGWMYHYTPYNVVEDTDLPSVEKDQLVKIKKITLQNLFTNPPSRYNQNSLLGEMEKAGIGTKATRADTIQTLYDRGYVKGDRMVATEMGFEVCQLLKKYCPAVVSIALT